MTQESTRKLLITLWQKRTDMTEFCEIGCLLCQQSIPFPKASGAEPCSLCGATNTKDHPATDRPLCAVCRQKQLYDAITCSLLAHQSTSPVEIALDSMVFPHLNICGKEFLYLVCGSLLTAYHNAERNIDLEKQLEKANALTARISGGACSLWSSFGTGLAANVFIGMLADLRGRAKLKRELTRQFLLKGIGSVAESNHAHGAVRCCRRNAIIILLSATSFVQEYFDIPITYPIHPLCSFDNFSRTCGRPSCLFYPNFGTFPSTPQELRGLILP